MLLIHKCRGTATGTEAGCFSTPWHIVSMCALDCTQARIPATSWIATATTVLCCSCAPTLPVPPPGTHQGDIPDAVLYPPPPARVEFVGPAPDERAVWVDGHWEWTGQNYAWTEGRWQHPHRRSPYAPAAHVRLRNGQLLYYRGQWHGAGDQPTNRGSEEESGDERPGP